MCTRDELNARMTKWGAWVTKSNEWVTKWDAQVTKWHARVANWGDRQCKMRSHLHLPDSIHFDICLQFAFGLCVCYARWEGRIGFIKRRHSGSDEVSLSAGFTACSQAQPSRPVQCSQSLRGVGDFLLAHFSTPRRVISRFLLSIFLNCVKLKLKFSSYSL